MRREKTVKRLLYAGVFIIWMAVIGGSIGAQEQADALSEDLPVLFDGDVVDGVFEENVTSQIFAFHGEAGDTVTITMTQDEDTLLDPYLVLLGPAGQVFAADDDSGDVFLASRIADFELPQDGTYLILATSFFYVDPLALPVDGLDVPEPYTLTLSGSGYDEDLDMNTIALDFGDIRDGLSDEEQPVTYYTFAAGPGDDILLLMDADDFQPVMHLFDPAGRRIAIDYNEIGGVDLPDEGVYLVIATDTFFYNLVPGASPAYTGGEFSLLLDG